MPPLKIVARPTSLVDGAPDDDQRHASSWGACNVEFHEANDAERLSMLLAKFVELTVMHEISAKSVHEALMVIPEYRAILPIDLDPTRHEEDR